ncbi:anti-sigma factor antagonist [Streptomyces sp. NPDC007905]|uniref:STAS domain-containing protein n=1 Tax=Streptomyces sp. NPDC007905 TaxID=3364788 RepID=UPI0036E86185
MTASPTGFEESVEDIDRQAGSNRLSITQTCNEGVNVVTVGGEIDHDSAPQLLQALTSHDTAAQRTVLDVSGVTFMDSSGINALITAHQAAESLGGWLRLAGPSPSVSRLIEIVGLRPVIACHSTVVDALRA